LGFQDNKDVLQGHRMREFSSPYFSLAVSKPRSPIFRQRPIATAATFLSLTSCRGPSADSASDGGAYTPPLAQESADLAPGEEQRWLVEGNLPSGSALAIAFSAEGPSGAALDIYLHAGAGDLLWDATLEGGSGGQFNELQACNGEFCAFGYVAKALHVQGDGTISLSIAAMGDMAGEGEIAITNLR
jgi:hypothetical protein